MKPIAALPMYDWPECRAETDAEWAVFGDRLRRTGIEAPHDLVRRNGDMPAVPGGIRDARGRVIAPDPATLPPDELDLHTLWRHPALLLAQTCWGPMETTGLAELVTVVGQPDYSPFAGGDGEYYRSAIVMRRADAGVCLPVALENLAVSGADNDIAACDALAMQLRGKRFAFNGPDSMSGIIALCRDLVAAGMIEEDGFEPLWSQLKRTGSHRGSIVAIANGQADVAAIDCRTLHLCQQFEPTVQDLAIVAWTAPRKGLPYIASRNFGDAVAQLLQSRANRVILG